VSRSVEMNDQIDTIAAAANREVYDAGWTRAFVEGAPHVKHAVLRKICADLLRRTMDRARESSAVPRVLDLGAGEGSVTSQLLELGAHVTAVDISANQLESLEKKCRGFGSRLELRHGEAREALKADCGRESYDVVVASAFLHHVPDYLGLIRDAMAVLRPRGQFLSLQDPLRYDRVSRFSRAFDGLAYYSWRVLQGDLWGGLKRSICRHCGRLADDVPLDNAEYHVLRNGVDQDAIAALLMEAGLACEIIRYFSTQSRLFQPIGAALGIENTFAVVACKRS
jgi:SAM-dependent methyltransferase